MAHCLLAQGPLIRSLTPADPVFAQLCSDVADSRRLMAAAVIDVEACLTSLAVYSYIPQKNDTLLTVSARCGIPYETIISANRISAGKDLVAGKTIILPATLGLFVPRQPASDFEFLVASARPQTTLFVPVTLNSGGVSTGFYYYPGAEFTPTERAYYFNIAFRFPLASARLTSGFGLRVNPITGMVKRHDGIDLAAPAGSEVYAARDGVVAQLGTDPVLGKFIIIDHEEGWKSVYGHLSQVLVVLRKNVKSGSVIGLVGSTGQSTGPHLHFELRRNGEARDPASLLPRGKTR